VNPSAAVGVSSSTMSTDAASSPQAALQVDPATLPDDAALLKSLVAQLFVQLQSRDGRISDLEHRMSLLLRKLYGSKSEKLDPRQTSLFDLIAAVSEGQTAVTNDSPPAAAGDSSPDEMPATTSMTKQRPGHGRRRLPDQLQRREVEHDLTDPEKEALGGAANLVVIGREVTEQLEWEPSCLYVIRHVQLTYARRQLLPESGLTLAEQNVATASKPPQPIAGGLPGPGLLAQVLTSKYADHIPLNRFQRISARHGVELSRQTTCGWAMQCADLLGPLYKLMIAEVLASYVVNADDTTVKIRDARRKLKCTGYFHTYVGDLRHPLIVFDYISGHGRDGPQNFLRNFRGYLQADAAPIYDDLFNHPKQLILEVGCWMHGRRNFFEDRATDRPRAELVLARIGQLYAVERELKARCADEWRDLPCEELEDRIVDVRQERSVPVLTALHAWLEAEKPKLLPKAALRGAMDYLLNHWQALVRYTTDGALAIDNGAAERALRGLTIGRKNWLFCGSERGAQAAAVHFSLIASCHRHGLDAFAYLRNVLTRLPLLGPAPSRDDLRPLLPDRWTKP
jgi:transposase